MAAAAATGSRRGLSIGKQLIRTAECERSFKVKKEAAERGRRRSQRASSILAEYASDNSQCSTNVSDGVQYLGHSEVERMLGDLSEHLFESADMSEALCIPTVEDIEFLFNLCDKRCGNNNGKIDEDEIIPVCDAWTAYLERADQISNLFAKFDTNRDGKIDVDELSALLEELNSDEEVPEEVTRWVLREADLGCDGALGAMELARGLCAFYRWRDKDDPRGKMVRVSRLIERDSTLPPPPPRSSGNSGSGVAPFCGGACLSCDEDSVPARVTRVAHSVADGSGTTPAARGNGEACCLIA